MSHVKDCDAFFYSFFNGSILRIWGRQYEYFFVVEQMNIINNHESLRHNHF